MSVEHDILSEYSQAKKASVSAEIVAKTAKIRLEYAEDNLTSFMIDSKIKSTAKFEGLGHATMVTPAVVFPAYDKNREEDLFSFVRDQGEGPIIKTNIHHASFKAFVARLIKSATVVPEFITYNLRSKVRFYGK